MKHKIITSLFILLGIAYQSNSQLKIEAGATFKTSSSVSVVLTDIDLENNGNFVQDTFSNVRFSGIQNSAIKGLAISNINNLEMAKDNNSILLLNNQVNIGKAVNFISGLIDLNGYNMLLDSSANIVGENESNRFIGSNGGYIQTTRYLAAPSMSNPGNLGATITSTAVLGNVIIRRGHTLQTGTGLSTSISRYYTITTKINTGLNARIRLQYFDGEKSNLDENTFAIYKKASSGSSWSKILPTSTNTTLNYVEKSGLNNLGTYTISGSKLVKRVGDTSYMSKVENPQEQKRIDSKTVAKETTMLQPKLTVGPNPNNGNFFFQLKGIEQSTSASLYTIDGKVIGQYKINEGQRQQVNGLKTGVYLLKVNGMEPYKVVVQ